VRPPGVEAPAADEVLKLAKRAGGWVVLVLSLGGDESPAQSAEQQDTTLLVQQDDKGQVSVFRAPRISEKDAELAYGLQPGVRISADKKKDNSGYVGQENVAQAYAGRAGYADGYIEWRMKKGFYQRFLPYMNLHNDTDPRHVGMQWRIPANLLPEFNGMIESTTWHNYYNGYKW
jgi:hypothetical protein